MLTLTLIARSDAEGYPDPTPLRDITQLLRDLALELEEREIDGEPVDGQVVILEGDSGDLQARLSVSVEQYRQGA